MPNKKYNWEAIIQDQATSDLSVKEYCLHHNINVKSFYHRRKVLATTTPDVFQSVEVVHPTHESLISLRINHTLIEVSSSVLPTIIQQLK